jgi:hypothetical protein
MSTDELDQVIEYARFFRRSILSKLFDVKYIDGSNNTAAADTYIAQFNHTVNVYAQVKDISQEEAFKVALEELDKLEDKNLAIIEQIKADLESAIKNGNKHTEELEASKEAFPNSYVAAKLNEAIAESMGIPKEALYPADRKVAIPSLGLGPNMDNRSLY